MSIYGAADLSTATLRYIQGSVRLHLLQAIALAAVGMIVAVSVDPESLWRKVALVYVILQVPYQLNDCVRRLLLARREFARLVQFDLTTVVGRVAGLLIVFGWGGLTAMDFSIGLASGYLACGILHLLTSKSHYWYVFTSDLYSSLVSVAKRNWPLTKYMLPEVLAYQATTHAFVLFSALLLRPLDVAVLGGIQAIANVVNVFLSGLTNYGLPDFARWKQRKNYLQWRRSVLRIGSLAIILTAACTSAFVLVPDLLIRSVYGPTSYMRDHASLLPLFGLVALARTASVVLVTAFRSIEFQIPITASTIGAGIVSILIGIPVIARYGPAGVVFGLAIGQTVLLGSLLLVLLCFETLIRRAVLRSASVGQDIVVSSQ